MHAAQEYAGGDENHPTAEMSTATVSEPFVFSPGTTSPVTTPAGGVDPLVDQTKREIAEIVREVAMAVRSDRTREQFLSLLSDRVLRALAAGGVSIWRRESSSSEPDEHVSSECVLRCVHEIGQITTKALPNASVPVHARLVREVLSESQPVVVPPTPGATDATLPANPFEVPVALAPIELERHPDGAEYLLEVFLEPDCGVATQRGYLRFVAQMADLAGEFLRSDQLRELRRGQILAARVDAALTDLHRRTDRRRLEALIVDRAAEIFGFDRVGLCIGEKLVAVSHVETIDPRSESAQQIVKAAMIDLPATGVAWLERKRATVVDEVVVRAVVAAVGDEHRDLPEMEPRLVALQSSVADPIDAECGSELCRFADHALIAHQNATRIESIPGGRLLTAIAPMVFSGRRRMLRNMLLTLLAMTVLLVIALFPLPLVVSSFATVRPSEVQMVIAPRNAVVDEIHVRHGQQVLAGDKLLSLIDPDLEEQIAGLAGRRSVLAQQQSHWNNALVDTGTHQLDRMERVQGEQRLVIEEIASIDEQLEVLQRAQRGLTIFAKQGGTVDAWQIEHRLQARPLKRGDQLLQVIPKNSAWIVDARIRQNRITHIENAADLEKLSATISLDADPSETYSVNLIQIGPSIREDNLGMTVARLQINEDAAKALANQQRIGQLSGAPARVMFRCGNAPVAYLMFQDVIRKARGTLALYWGGNANRIAEPNKADMNEDPEA